MQAIILAAGMGKRLGKYTQDNTKCMVEVNGERLIDRVLRQLSRLNLRRVIIVVGYKADNLISYIGDRYEGQIKVEYIHNPVYDKTNNIYSLALAKAAMCEDDTLLLESDIIFEDSVIETLAHHPDPDLALVAKCESWMDGTMVCIDKERNITSFVSKADFNYHDADRYYKTVNIYKFSQTFSANYYIPFLEAYCKALGRNEYYEQVLQVLVHIHRSPLKALPLDGERWYEIDDAQDLDIASALFAPDNKKFDLYHRRYGGFWRFPKMLDYCYLVNPFFPTPRMKEEMRANFETLLQNYPSGMYVNSLLAAKYFKVSQEYIVVGNGAAELIKSITTEYHDKKVGVIYPTFDEYPNRLADGNIVGYIVRSDDFRYTADDIISYYGDKDISILLLVNPDNPSGNFIPKDDVLRIAGWCREREVRLLVDESFVDFTEGFEHNSIIDDGILEAYPNLMVMKSISKSYGVPGLRLGILATADTKLIARIKKDVSIWNINSFAEFYLQIYGKYEKDYTKACRDFAAERARFHKLLLSIPYLHVMPSEANYFLCRVRGRFTSRSLADELIRHNIIISDCSRKRHMTGQQIVRLAIRSAAENDRLIAILRNL